MYRLDNFDEFSQIDIEQDPAQGQQKPIVEPAKPAQQRQVEKVADSVKMGVAAAKDAQITADKTTTTYNVRVPAGASDEQMDKIV